MSESDHSEEFADICLRCRLQTRHHVCYVEYGPIIPNKWWHEKSVSKMEMSLSIVPENAINDNYNVHYSIAQLMVTVVPSTLSGPSLSGPSLSGLSLSGFLSNLLTYSEAKNLAERLAMQSIVQCYTSYMQFHGSARDVKLPKGVNLITWSYSGWKMLLERHLFDSPITTYKGRQMYKTGLPSVIYEKLAERIDCFKFIHPLDYTDKIRGLIATTNVEDCRGLQLLGREHQTRELCLMAYRNSSTSFCDILNLAHKNYVLRIVLSDVLCCISHLGLSINAIAEIASLLFDTLSLQYVKKSHQGAIPTVAAVFSWHEMWKLAAVVHCAGRTSASFCAPEDQLAVEADVAAVVGREFRTEVGVARLEVGYGRVHARLDNQFEIARLKLGFESARVDEILLVVRPTTEGEQHADFLTHRLQCLAGVKTVQRILEHITLVDVPLIALANLGLAQK